MRLILPRKRQILPQTLNRVVVALHALGFEVTYLLNPKASNQHTATLPKVEGTILLCRTPKAYDGIVEVLVGSNSLTIKDTASDLMIQGLRDAGFERECHDGP